MIEGSIKEIEAIDRILSEATETCELIKDGSKSGSKAFVKVYAVRGNPSFKRIRIFFDRRDNKGTIKVRDYQPMYLGICTFTLIQVFMLVLENLPGLS